MKFVFRKYLTAIEIFQSQLLLCGTGEYSIADFKANHIVNGSSQEFRRVLDWFYAAISNFSQTEMARLLQFTTGCSQVNILKKIKFRKEIETFIFHPT
jgi:HECT-domain (ubiquitin-transferase)